MDSNFLSSKIMTTYEQQILKCIESNSERQTSKILAKYPEILRWSVCKTGGHCTYVIKEFPFGSNFRADFIVAMSYSFIWEVHLIELELPCDIIITKKGLPSNRLNSAMSQINDWRMYIGQNQDQFKRDLTNWCLKKDILNKPKLKGIPTNFTGNYLNSLDTSIQFRYHIFIGNRSSLIDNRDKVLKLNQYRSSDLNIHTYGRLQDIAKNHDDFNRNPYERHDIAKTEEDM